MATIRQRMGDVLISAYIPYEKSLGFRVVKVKKYQSVIMSLLLIQWRAIQKSSAGWGWPAGIVWLTLVASIGMSYGGSLEIYDEIVADARRCAAQEQCSVAGGVKGCRCPVAVRSDAKERVAAATREASCVQVERLYCPPLENPRCEKDVCVADQVRE
jgi:hypothetical protein